MNGSNISEVSLAQDLPRVLRCSGGALCTLCILLANLIIIITLSHATKFLSRQTRIFLLNVALIDMLTGLCIIPPLTVLEISLNPQIFTRMFYFYWLTIGGILINARVLSLVLVAFDRYIAICHSMRYQHLLTFSRARLAVIISWGVALCLIVPKLAIFIMELVTSAQNGTTFHLKPYDWTYTTSIALRRLRICMFFVRFVLPLTVSFVIDVLAFRIAIKSSAGFQQGVLKVKEPESSTANNTEERNPKSFMNSHPLRARRSGFMRIHRGNYMNEATKDLFAQLPRTNRSLNRRTAVLPNINVTSSRATKHTVKPQRLPLPKTCDSSYPKVIDEPKTPGTSTTSPGTNASTPTPSSTKANADKAENAIKAEEHTSQKNSWWQLNSASTSSVRHWLKCPRKLSKDLGSMIPMTTLLVAFVVFTLPYQFLQVIDAIVTETQIPNEVHANLFWLACTNALVNPVILTFWSSACRDKVLHFLSCGRFHHNQAAIKRLIIASFGTANLPYGRQVHPQSVSD